MVPRQIAHIRASGKERDGKLGAERLDKKCVLGAAGAQCMVDMTCGELGKTGMKEQMQEAGGIKAAGDADQSGGSPR
jgi:hypothetical protein